MHPYLPHHRLRLQARSVPKNIGNDGLFCGNRGTNINLIHSMHVLRKYAVIEYITAYFKSLIILKEFFSDIHDVAGAHCNYKVTRSAGVDNMLFYFVKIRLI